MSNNFRDYLLPADSARIAAARGVTPAVYAQRMLATEKARDLKRHWQSLLDTPFQGITTNGKVEPGLFSLADEGFDPAPAVAAALALLAAFFAKAAGAATAASLYAAGTITAAQATILFPACITMGTLIGHFARVVMVCQVRSLYYPVMFLTPIIDAVIVMWLTRAILFFYGIA